MTLPTHMPCHVCRTASTCIILLCAIYKGSEQHVPACPHAAISLCVEAPVADTAIWSAGSWCGQRLKMPVLQGPPIEDDEEDYDEEEPPLSEDIEDEEDVDDEAGPSAAAGSRGTIPLL